MFKDNIEELFKLGAASIHKENKFINFKSFKVKKKNNSLLVKNFFNQKYKRVFPGSWEIRNILLNILFLVIKKRSLISNFKNPINSLDEYVFNICN